MFLLHIGYQQTEKTAVAFIDISSAYDTAWKTGHFTRFLEVIIPNRKLYLNNMISGRTFTATAEQKESRKRTLNNGLPRGYFLYLRLSKNIIKEIYLCR